jgi:hypothetical protein
MEGIKKEDIEKVASHLERYASDSTLATLENLAQVAVFKETAARERAKIAAEQAAAPTTVEEKLHLSLAASVGLGRA